MILGFKPQFKPLILDGCKIHTIREDKNDRWKVGTKIQMATGVRTKNYEQFAEAVVTKIMNINIKWNLCENGEKSPLKNDPSRYPTVIVSNTLNYNYYFENFSELIFCRKHLYDMTLFALNDGFNSPDEFFAWFNKDFTGKIIFWSNLKPTTKKTPIQKGDIVATMFNYYEVISVDENQLTVLDLEGNGENDEFIPIEWVDTIWKLQN